MVIGDPKIIWNSTQRPLLSHYSTTDMWAPFDHTKLVFASTNSHMWRRQLKCLSVMMNGYCDNYHHMSVKKLLPFLNGQFIYLSIYFLVSQYLLKIWEYFTLYAMRNVKESLSEGISLDRKYIYLWHLFMINLSNYRYISLFTFILFIR